MLHAGLVSVTFRNLAPRTIVELVAQAGLRAIEWGGDIHVPPGDLQTAREVKSMTLDAGLTVAAYGSYFRFRSDDVFETVLETAAALGAPLIRVWAGDRPSAAADASFREMIVAESRRIVKLAAVAGIAVAYEFHSGTLTYTTSSACALLKSVPGMHTLWQPAHNLSGAQQVASLHAIQPWLMNIRAFSWTNEPRVRHPLAVGEQLWLNVLNVLMQSEQEHAVLLEFVANDEPQQFLQDAATLFRWIRHVTATSP